MFGGVSPAVPVSSLSLIVVDDFYSHFSALAAAAEIAGDSVDNTVENSSILSLIGIHWLPSARV